MQHIKEPIDMDATPTNEALKLQRPLADDALMALASIEPAFQSFQQIFLGDFALPHH
jgi:hypothetical protein